MGGCGPTALLPDTGRPLPGESITAATAECPNLRRVVVGCPAYFADHGVPVEPQDLTHHRCCSIRLQTSGGLYAWEFERDRRSVNVHVDDPLVLNDSHLLVDAALHGAGLAMVMEDMAAPFIADDCRWTPGPGVGRLEPAVFRLQPLLP